MAAALQTPRHAHDERGRQLIQRVMIPNMVVSLPRYHTGSLEARYAGVGDGQTFKHLATVWESDSTAFMQ
ncbi:hypothetical protein [Chloroflexus aurantiacus]|jgi:hypothetical protein